MLGEAVERAFYARTPPSKRPLHLRAPTHHQPAAVGSSKESENELDLEKGDDTELVVPRGVIVGNARPISDSEDKGKTGALKPPKVKKGKDGKAVDEMKSLPKAEEGGKVYDQSLLKAINRVVFWRSVRTPSCLRPHSPEVELGRRVELAPPSRLLTCCPPFRPLAGSGPPVSSV